MSFIIKKKSKPNTRKDSSNKKRNRLKKMIIGKGILPKNPPPIFTGTNKNTGNSTSIISTSSTLGNPYNFGWDEEDEEEIDMAKMIETAIKAKLNVKLGLRENYNFANLAYIMTFAINKKTKEKVMKNLYIRRTHDKVNTIIPNLEFKNLGVHWYEVSAFLIKENARTLNTKEFFETIK